MKIYNDWSWKPTPEVEASIYRGERLFKEWKNKTSEMYAALRRFQRMAFRAGIDAKSAPFAAHREAVFGVQGMNLVTASNLEELCKNFDDPTSKKLMDGAGLW